MKLINAVRILLLVMVLVVGAVVTAQNGSVSPDPEFYADIPQVRAEDGAFVLGDPNAPVTVIVFSDYLCPHCQTYEETTVHQFIEQFVSTGMAKFEYRMYPVIDRTYSPLLAVINECAGEQGMFWPARDLLFEMAINQQISVDVAEVLIERLELDTEDFETCVEIARQYVEDATYGRDVGVTGTPAIRVRVGDGEAGAITIDDRVYEGGGVPLDVLRRFVISANPQELIALVNQLRDERLLQDTSLVSGEPCSPPCWRGIIPGETAWEDALQIVEEDEQLADINIETADVASRAVWGQADGDLCCEMVTIDGGTVGYLRLLVAPQMRLGEVIETRGEPTYLIGSEHTRHQAFFALFYTNVPMLVFVFVAGEAEGELSEDSEIIGVQYFRPEDVQRILEAQPALLEWDGFKSFQDYMDDDFAVISEPES